MRGGSVLGIGIVGSGLMGRTYAETTVRHNRKARLVVVAGGRRAQGLAAEYGAAFEPSLERLIMRRDVDAVIIATPEATHLETTCLAAAAGKHVLVEKPMALDVAQCDAMIEACRTSGVTLMVVQSQRFRGVNRRAKQLLDEGHIGRVWQMRFSSLILLASSLSVATERPWQYDASNGGAFLGQSVHAFDLLRWLAGSEARRVFAHVRDYADHTLTDLTTMAQVEFENGVIGQVWTCYEMPGATFPHSQFHCQIVGEDGLLDFDAYSYLDLLRDGTTERVWEQSPFNPLDPLDPVRLESFAAQNQAFIDAVLNKHPPPVSGADGRAAVELCQACLQSARTEQVVELPL